MTAQWPLQKLVYKSLQLIDLRKSAVSSLVHFMFGSTKKGLAWATFSMLLTIALWQLHWQSKSTPITNSSRPYATALLGNVPKVLDPASLTEVNYVTLFNQVCARLTNINSGLNLEGDLAKSWEISTDKKTYTFHLNSNRTFFNRDPVTAEDVKFSLERMVDRRQLVKLLQASTSVVDTNTLKLTLQQPNPRLLYDLSSPTYCVLSKSHPFIEHESYRWPNSAGAYKISRSTSEDIDLESWDPLNEKAKAEKHIKIYFRSQADAVALFDSGKIDDLSFYFLSEEEQNRIANNSKKVNSRIFWSWALTLNKQSSIFSVTENRESLVGYLLKTRQEFLKLWSTQLIEGASVVPAGMRSNISYDPSHLSTLLFKAHTSGVEKYCETHSLRVSAIDGLPDQERLKKSLFAVLSGWNSNCSIAVDFLPMDEWMTSYQKGTYDLYFSGLDPDSLDPISYFRYFIKGSDSNTLGYNSPELDKLFLSNSHRAEADRDADLILKMNEIFYKEAYGIVFGYPKFDFYYSKSVIAAHLNPLGMQLNRWWEFHRNEN